MSKTQAIKAKIKFGSYDEAKEALLAAKEERRVASDEFKALLKEHKLSKDAAPENEKLAKKWNRANDTLKRKREAIETVEAYLKENKPKKVRTPRPTKYNYPEGMSSADKKKLRTVERAKVKKAEKEAAGGGKKKKKNKDKKGAGKTEEVKKKKKKKKNGNKAEGKPAETQAGSDD